MSLVIVPNEVSEAIRKTIDKAAEGLIISSEEYDQHYNTILNYYDEHGIIPEIKLTKELADE
jgi:hypothetical protein